MRQHALTLAILLPTEMRIATRQRGRNSWVHRRGRAIPHLVSTPAPSFFARLWLALVAPLRLLFDSRFAAAVVAAREPALPAETPAPEPETEDEPAPRVSLTRPPADAALQLLGLFQREGRFVDFLMEDVSGFSDADIGAAARVVHEGCKRALLEHSRIESIRSEDEGESVTIEPGFDAHEIRLTGNVTGEGPHRGELAHAGWRVRDLSLPQLTAGHDAEVVAPAEVELP